MLAPFLMGAMPRGADGVVHRGIFGGYRMQLSVAVPETLDIQD
jgi:hypothetical protein